MDNEVDSEAKAPLSVYAVLATFVDQMAGIAWIKLGLQPDFVTGEIAFDVGEAKVAIDTVAELVRILDTELDEEDRRRLQSLVRDLRLNYVNKQQQSGT